MLRVTGKQDSQSVTAGRQRYVYTRENREKMIIKSRTLVFTDRRVTKRLMGQKPNPRSYLASRSKHHTPATERLKQEHYEYQNSPDQLSSTLGVHVFLYRFCIYCLRWTQLRTRNQISTTYSQQGVETT